MKKAISALFALFVLSATSQIKLIEELPNPKICNTSEAMKSLFDSNEKAKKENDAFEVFTAEYVKQNSASKTSTAVCYIIPVVFHVYGTMQSGQTVTDAKIIVALANVNKDFQGLNPDFNTVHNSFLGIRGTMPDLNFALAQLDPNGNPTSGIVYHPVASGYGNATGYDALIAADAWDNNKYMNIYIQNDLYNNAVLNNSGIAWYPNTFMTNNNTARIVYNGAYLGTNTNTEFASTLSHEYGHWLNLIHTFEGGCVAPNDNVADTPPCDYGGASYTCHASPTSTYPVNCNTALINAENYMDYSGAGGCYKMFTQGQVTRAYAGLQHAARQPLWQMSNLLATGLSQLCLTTNLKNANFTNENLIVFPNPTNENVNINVPNALLGSDYTISNQLGMILLEGKIISENTNINLETTSRGIYFIRLKSSGEKSLVKKIIRN